MCQEDGTKKNVAGIARRLANGSIYVKEGHRIGNTNPTGEERDIPLTGNQISNRWGNYNEQMAALFGEYWEYSKAAREFEIDIWPDDPSTREPEENE